MNLTPLTRIPALVAVFALFVSPAWATESDENTELAATAPATTAPATTTTTTTTTTAPPAGEGTVVSTDADVAATDEKTSPWGAGITAEVGVGLGTFVSGDQNNPLVVSSFAPSISYKVLDKVKLKAGFSLTWYNKPDFDTPLAEGKVLMSDVSLSVSHASFWKHEDSGFNISGAFSVGLPTSLASQYQNRIFSMKPSVKASLPVGPVSFSYTFGFTKYFSSSATPSVDCDAFDDPALCGEGREDNSDFGLESERRGAELFVRSSGVASYAFQNSFSVGWDIIEDLNLSAGVSIYNVFGVRSFDDDALANVNAREGRSQSDRLVSTIALGYQIIKQVGVELSLVNDNGRLFGDSGDALVPYNFKRISDNSSSINFAVTGSL